MKNSTKVVPEDLLAMKLLLVLISLKDEGTSMSVV
jgi:hypothetical protein